MEVKTLNRESSRLVHNSVRRQHTKRPYTKIVKSIMANNVDSKHENHDIGKFKNHIIIQQLFIHFGLECDRVEFIDSENKNTVSRHLFYPLGNPDHRILQTKFLEPN